MTEDLVTRVVTLELERRNLRELQILLDNGGYVKIGTERHYSFIPNNVLSANTLKDLISKRIREIATELNSL